MNLPNKLTILRTILIVPFVIIMLTGCLGVASNWVALAIFVIASLTDLLDGKIARKYNLVTNFGKFMDPLADKLLVCAALICLMSMDMLPAWAVIVIMSREFIISGFRLIASDNGVVIAASMWGKFKTVFQMAMIIALIVIRAFYPSAFWNNFMLLNPVSMEGFVVKFLTVVGSLLVWIALILTVVSLIDYIVKNKNVMKDTK